METLESTAVMFTVTASKVSASESIPTVDYIVVKNKETGKWEEREIRYIPGERSIFADEQREGAETKGSEIIFRHGTLIVNTYEITLLEYLRMCNYNKSNPSRKQTSTALFTERKAGEESKNYLNDDKHVTEIKYRIHNMSASELEAIAYYIGMTNASKKQSDDLRRDMLLLATKKQDLFLNAINDMRITRVYHVVNLALEEGIIKFINNSVQDRVGKELFTCRSSSDLMEEFTTWLTRGQGSGVYNNILKQVDPNGDYSTEDIEGVKVLKKVELEEDETESAVDYMEMFPKDLFDLAIEKNIFRKEGAKIFYNNGDGEKFLAKNMKDAINLIATKREFKKDLINLLQLN